MESQTSPAAAPRPFAAGLLTRRSIIIPTWRGWLLLLLPLIALGCWAFFSAYDFFAPQDRLSANVLVVEGYAGDNMLHGAVAEFQSHHYDLLIVTGGPIEHGELLSEYKTLPDVSVAIMAKMGLDPKMMRAVPGPAAVWDRTYTSAVALRKWLRENHMTVTQINLMAEGFHSRRSRLMFQKALGDGVQVGIIAYEWDHAAAQRWWNSSEGVRHLTDEALAYIYARFFFRQPKEEQSNP